MRTLKSECIVSVATLICQIGVLILFSEAGIFQENAGVNKCPKTSETVYPGIWGILKQTACPGQPEIFKTVYRNIKSTSFEQCSRISSIRIAPMKERQVCVCVDLIPRHHNFLHLFGPKLSITNKNF